MQHSSPSAPASSSSTRVANCNATPVSVLPGNGDDGPHCIHGPAIKFERGGVVFYACSVERDNKSGGGGECGFRHNVDKEGEMTDAKLQKWKARDEINSFSNKSPLYVAPPGLGRIHGPWYM